MTENKVEIDLREIHCGQIAKEVLKVYDEGLKEDTVILLPYFYRIIFKAQTRPQMYLAAVEIAAYIRGACMVLNLPICTGNQIEACAAIRCTLFRRGCVHACG